MRWPVDLTVAPGAPTSRPALVRDAPADRATVTVDDVVVRTVATLGVLVQAHALPRADPRVRRLRGRLPRLPPVSWRHTSRGVVAQAVPAHFAVLAGVLSAYRMRWIVVTSASPGGTARAEHPQQRDQGSMHGRGASAQRRCPFVCGRASPLVVGARRGFRGLTGGFERILACRPVAYVETGYFRGVGEQRAAVWDDDAIGPALLQVEEGRPFPPSAVRPLTSCAGRAWWRAKAGTGSSPGGLYRHRQGEAWIA
jgi:hypothetical protein